MENVLDGYPANPIRAGSVTYINADITTVTAGMVCHGVNCQRVMGSGVAASIRAKWPKVFSAYTKYIDENGRGLDVLGGANIVMIDPTLYVANCFTQNFYGADGRRYASLDAISTSLAIAFERAHELDLVVYLPEIGGKRGGVDFVHEVLSIIEAAAVDYVVQVRICMFEG